MNRTNLEKAYGLLQAQATLNGILFDLVRNDLVQEYQQAESDYATGYSEEIEENDPGDINFPFSSEEAEAKVREAVSLERRRRDLKLDIEKLGAQMAQLQDELRATYQYEEGETPLQAGRTYQWGAYPG